MANLYLIRQLCSDKNISLRELCNRIGRDESTLQSAIRRGSTNTATIELIAKELEVSPGYFFDGFKRDNSSELEKENAHLKELLKEKERLIEVLMSDRD